MRKIAFVKLALTLAILLSAAALSGTARAQDAAKIRVTIVHNGTLGDKSFFDSANRGLEKAKADLGVEFKTIELGFEASKWEAGLDDAISDEANYDILITGTFQMADFITARADAHPTKRFIVYDTAVDYTKCKCANVFSILYKQNEGSYLAGVYAAATLKEGKLAKLQGKNTIGAVGGLPIPVIDDFIKGYTQGAKSVDPNINVLVQYVGGDKAFGDPAKGKEIALSMYDQGADVIFQIAALSGQGVIEAAAERGLYAIGVDSDQAEIFRADKKDNLANAIITSMLKNVDNSLFLALSLHKEGKLEYGTVGSFGLKEGGVGLAMNDTVKKNTPESVMKLVDQAQADILSGKIKVDSAFAPAMAATPAATMAATAAK
jgi:basic membrane protein A and related proteins